MPNESWAVSLDATSLLPGTPLVVVFSGPDVAGYVTAQCSVARVERDEDEWVLTSGGHIEVDRGACKVTILQTRDLRSGLHRLSELILMPSLASDPNEPGARRVPLESVLFEVLDQGALPRPSDQLRAEYQRIIEEREAEFLAGIGESRPDSEEFQALVFIKDCYMQTRMRLGRYELIPLGGLGCHDEIALMNEFLNGVGQPPIESTAEPVARARIGQPSIVLFFPRVRATSVDGAGEIIKKEAALLCDVLALHRNSYGAAFGGFLLRPGTGQRFYWIDTPTYSGNLMGGLLSGEFPRAIRHHLQRARSNPRAALYLALLREALREEQTEVAYFRFWNLLETIARSRGFEGKPQVDWGSAQKLQANGAPVGPIRGAESLVFELLRSVMAGHVAPNALGGRLTQGTFEGLVPIWYRHRNCMVHGGGCLPDDSSFCLRTDAKYVNCRLAHEEVTTRNGPRDRLNDEYLRALRDTTTWVVQAECG
jgi:hypothetical protein